MLRISKLADYGCVILHCLSINPDHMLSATEVAEKTYLKRPTVSKLLKILLEAGLVVSARGTDGGYGLSKKPTQITLAKIITAVEGSPTLTECAEHTRCAQQNTCQIRPHWQVINYFILKILETVTLDDLKLGSVSNLMNRMLEAHKNTAYDH